MVLGVNHTHSDHARTPINGVGARGLTITKKGILKEKQVFAAFKGDTYGQNVTVSTEFGPFHGVVLPYHEQINIRFWMGK